MNLIIADTTLTDLSGHSFEYSRSLCENAQQRGFNCTTLAQVYVSAQVIREIPTIPCFSHGVGHVFMLPLAMRAISRQLDLGWQPRFNQWAHGRMMFYDLRDTESKLELTSETLVIVPTTYDNQIGAYVRWAESLPAQRRPRFALVFHSSAYPEFTHNDRWEQLYRRAFARLERSPAVTHFRLFTDTEELAEEFEGYTRLPVHVVPIPHATGTSSPEAARSRRYHSQDPICVSYLGFSNGLNKGFYNFGPLFSRLRPYFESGRIVAEIQGNISTPEWPHVQSSLRRLREMPQVTLHEQPLSTDEFYGLMNRADVVVLPYTTETYHSQTSGVFSEAVAHGKPVVVPRGTWMARQLKEHAAGVTFIPKDLQSLYDAVVESVDRYAELSQRAAERAPRWRARHCVPSYLDAIFRTMGAA
jgi:glycosyltransferase involved in cell wall biosynthesis